MKKILLFPLVALVALSACGGKGEKSEAPPAAGPAVAEKAPDGPVADSPTHMQSEVKLGGHTYALSVDRRAATDLPTVTDWEGDEYYDNTCEIDIRRDGQPFAHRVFTLDDFRPYLEEPAREGARLLGMAYDSERSDGGRLMFGAQVGQAGMDGGPAFCVAFSTSGGSVSIAPDTQQDTGGGEMGD